MFRDQLVNSTLVHGRQFKNFQDFNCLETFRQVKHDHGLLGDYSINWVLKSTDVDITTWLITQNTTITRKAPFFSFKLKTLIHERYVRLVQIKSSLLVHCKWTLCHVDLTPTKSMFFLLLTSINVPWINTIIPSLVSVI